MARRSDAAVNAEADAVCRLLNAGSLELLDGPTRVARLTFHDPAFHPASDGIALAYPVTPDTDTQPGTVTQFRACRANGTPVFSGSVGTRDADLILSQTHFRAHDHVAVERFSYQASRT